MTREVLSQDSRGMSGCMHAWELHLCAQFSQHIAENIRGSRSITRPWVPGVVQGHPFMGRAKATVDSRQGNSSPEAQSHCFPGSLEFQSQVPMVSAIHNGKGMGHWAIGVSCTIGLSVRPQDVRETCVRVLQEPLASLLGHHHIYHSAQPAAAKLPNLFCLPQSLGKCGEEGDVPGPRGSGLQTSLSLARSRCLVSYTVTKRARQRPVSQLLRCTCLERKAPVLKRGMNMH